MRQPRRPPARRSPRSPPRSASRPSRGRGRPCAHPAPFHVRLRPSLPSTLSKSIHSRRVVHFFTHHGLPLLFLVVMLESFGLPLPGETVLIFFGVLASQGNYSIVEVIAIATAAAIIGDNLGYWLIGRLWGGGALRQKKEPRPKGGKRPS